jgi:hypothetical protein
VPRTFQNIVVKNIFSIYDPGRSTKYHILEFNISGIYFFNIDRRGKVMKLRIKMVVLVAVACFAFGIAGCGEKGTAEKAGKKVDKAAESAKDAIHDATK